MEGRREGLEEESEDLEGNMASTRLKTLSSLLGPVGLEALRTQAIFMAVTGEAVRSQGECLHAHWQGLDLRLGVPSLTHYLSTSGRTQKPQEVSGSEKTM